jgi:hypothetical protein
MKKCLASKRPLTVKRGRFDIAAAAAAGAGFFPVIIAVMVSAANAKMWTALLRIIQRSWEQKLIDISP